MPTANQRKAFDFERELAAYFREHGIATARRRVTASINDRFAIRADEGDLEGIPGFCVAAMNWPSRPWGLTGKVLHDAMDQNLAQCHAAEQVIPLLIEKRYSDGDVCWSFVHARLRHLVALVLRKDPDSAPLRGLNKPVRVMLCDVIDPIVDYSRQHAELNGVTW